MKNTKEYTLTLFPFLPNFNAFFGRLKRNPNSQASEGRNEDKPIKRERLVLKTKKKIIKNPKNSLTFPQEIR
jgi:hypothetical protein